jgi:hypothetical protein
MTGGRDLPTVVVPDAWPDDEIGPVLQFVATTNGRLGCSVIALCDLVAVGSIRWWGGGDDDDDDPDNNAGLIGFLHVGEQWRRQGDRQRSPSGSERIRRAPRPRSAPPLACPLAGRRRMGRCERRRTGSGCQRRERGVGTTGSPRCCPRVAPGGLRRVRPLRTPRLTCTFVVGLGRFELPTS